MLKKGKKKEGLLKITLLVIEQKKGRKGKKDR